MKPYPLQDIALVGMGASGLQLLAEAYHYRFAREKGKSEVWVLNAGGLVFQHDLLFNMHDLRELAKREPERPFIKAYEKHPTPVVTTRWIPEIENCYEYPFSEMFEEFGEVYFACAPSYMVAFALMCFKKAKVKGRLRLYGFDFNYPGRTDYEAGRANLEYWIGKAATLGVEIVVPDGSTLLDSYGRSYNNGVIGYGAVYGFFNWQPVFERKSGRLHLLGFTDQVGAKSPPGEENNVRTSSDGIGVQAVPERDGSARKRGDRAKGQARARGQAAGKKEPRRYSRSELVRAADSGERVANGAEQGRNRYQLSISRSGANRAAGVGTGTRHRDKDAHQ